METDPVTEMSRSKEDNISETARTVEKVRKPSDPEQFNRPTD
jgi:hypothetical protein